MEDGRSKISLAQMENASAEAFYHFVLPWSIHMLLANGIFNNE